MKEEEPLSKRLEDIYRKVLETISEHIVYYDKDFKIIWANKTAADSFNLTPEQLIGKNCYNLWQGRNKPCEECPVLKTLKFGGVNSKEMIILDGRWWFIEGYPVFDNTNKISGVVEIARDITERRVAEQKLKESEVKYRNILENMLEGYFETDLRGNFIYANIEYCKIMGYSKEEIVGKNFRLLYDTQSSELLFSMFNQVYKTGIPRPPTGVAKVTTKKKKLIYFEGSIDLLYDSKGNKVGFYGLVRDITKRKIAEQKLKKSEEKYRSLFENMNTGFALHEVIVDDNNKPVDYRYIEVNPAFERFTGIKKENLIGKTVTEAIPGTENDPADWIGKFGNVGLTGIPLTVEDYSEALDRWYKVSGYSPRKGYFAVTFTDITERKKAEDALKESEEKFRTIAEQSFMSIYIIQDGIFKYFNERVPKVNGYSSEEIKNWKPYEFAKLIHPDDRDFVMEQARKKEVGEKGVIKQYRYRIIRKDGEIRWLENFSKTINYKGRPADFIMSIDITEQMNAEKQLRRSEKKYREAFNRSNFYKDLISHDINNVLQNILSSVELCSLYLDKEKNLNEVKQLLKMSKNQVGRAANLISNTRKLSRLEEVKIPTQPIEAIEVLNQSIDFLLKSLQEKKINIQFENPYKVITVQANELLIDVFENILINAVKYNHNFLVEIKIKVSKLRKDGLKFVKFEFEDNGIGIPDTNKGSVFQRAYNVDRTVSGMGIGLSLVKKILSTYKGQIWIEDKVKGDYTKGSNFVVLIPEV
ncbi:MAG: PAS domain S-box protein [Promethearchaeota archaeon]